MSIILAKALCRITGHSNECTKAVEDYSRGVIGKTQAVFVIASELVGMAAQQNGGADPTTLQSYLGMLEDIDRGRSGQGGSGGHDDGGVTDAAAPRGGSRAGEALAPQSPQSEQGSRESSAEPEEPPAKRSRADPSRYAWAATDFLLETQLHPHIVRTLELLRNYGEDIARVRPIAYKGALPAVQHSKRVLTGGRPCSPIARASTQAIPD